MSHFTIIQRSKSKSGLENHLTKESYRVIPINSFEYDTGIIEEILKLSSNDKKLTPNYTVFFISGKNSEIPKLFTLDPAGNFFSELDLISGDSFTLVYSDFINVNEQFDNKDGSYKGLMYIKEEGNDSILIDEILSNPELIKNSEGIKFPLAIVIRHSAQEDKEINEVGVIEFLPSQGWDKNPELLRSNIKALMLKIRDIIEIDKSELIKEEIQEPENIKEIKDRYSKEIAEINVNKIIIETGIKTTVIQAFKEMFIYLGSLF